MKFSAGENLILAMLGDIYRHLKVEGEIDARFIAEAIGSGNEWGIAWRYPGLFPSGQATPPTVTEVVDILDMWAILERRYKTFSEEEKGKIAAGVEYFNGDLAFDGFDGNATGGHYGIAQFLINDLERFGEFKSRNLNSHYPTLDGYSQMLPVYLAARSASRHGELSTDAVIAILQARYQ